MRIEKEFSAFITRTELTLTRKPVIKDFIIHNNQFRHIFNRLRFKIFIRKFYLTTLEQRKLFCHWTKCFDTEIKDKQISSLLNIFFIFIQNVKFK